MLMQENQVKPNMCQILDIPTVILEMSILKFLIMQLLELQHVLKQNIIYDPAVFQDDLVRHQVKYLGLMENLRVRRAGFAYRRPFPFFLQRYMFLFLFIPQLIEGTGQEARQTSNQLEQRCQDLCWKVRDPAQSFGLH